MLSMIRRKLSHCYRQYELNTAIYMLEPAEKFAMHTFFFTIFGLITYSSMPQNLNLPKVRKENINNQSKMQNKGQQKEARKKQKNKKTVVKNILENPFVLDLSYVDDEYEKELVKLLESCCQDLKLPECKPPREKVQSLRGEERKKYIEEFRKDFIETLQSDPISSQQYELAKEARSHLIFGYNAVMRALEKNSLAGILVKRDAQPSFVVETFLPGCVNNRIPLVPVLHLDKLLQSENTLAIKHSVMVLGLKLSVKEEQCRFYTLYEKMTKILEDMQATHRAVKVHHSTESDNSHENHECTVSEVKEESSGLDEYSPTEIQKYHLKRLRKGERVFIPRSKRAKIEALDVIPVKEASEETYFSWDLIPVKADNKGSNFLEEEQKPFLGAFRNKKPEVKRTSATPASTNFSFNFFLDTSGDVKEDEVASVAETKGKAELEGKENKMEKMIMKHQNAGKIKAPGNKIKKKRRVQVFGEAGIREKEKSKQMKKKLKPSVSYSYIEAKTKRIKNNPNRKGMKKQ